MATPQILPLVPVGPHMCYPTISTATIIPYAPGASRIMVQAIGENIRYTLDGTTPKSNKGFRLNADSDPLLIYWTSNMVITVIAESEGATFEAQWMREG